MAEREKLRVRNFINMQNCYIYISAERLSHYLAQIIQFATKCERSQLCVYLNEKLVNVIGLLGLKETRIDQNSADERQ